MSDDAPTLGEIIRRLDGAVDELREMRREIAEDRRRMAAEFLRRVEFDLAQQSDAILIRGLENEAHSITKRLDVVDSKVETKAAELHSKIDSKSVELTSKVEKVEERRRTEKALLWTSLGAPIVLLILGALLAAGRLT